ncbi:hypothetical protein Tco_1464833 [Tanacetum coccineum]
MVSVERVINSVGPAVTVNWAVYCTMNPPVLSPIPPEGSLPNIVDYVLIAVASQPSFLSSVATSTSMMSAAAIPFAVNSVSQADLEEIWVYRHPECNYPDAEDRKVNIRNVVADNTRTYKKYDMFLDVMKDFTAQRDMKRFLSAVYHLNENHLAYNVTSLLRKGIQLKTSMVVLNSYL